MPFPLLFSSIKLGSLLLPNRLVMPAITTNLAKDDGSVTKRLIDFYVARAQGGVGMVIVEQAIVSIEGKRLPFNIGIWYDKQIEGLSKLAQSIREAGAIAVIQLAHGGRESNSAYSGFRPVAPTSLPSIFRGTTLETEKPQELSQKDIEHLISKFVQAARRGKEAGFQAVELHGCHGYLIAQFLSAYTNKRTDLYGGSLENRARFLTKIIEGIKKACGPDFPVLARINGNDYVPDGNLESDAARIGIFAQEAGVDGIHVSAGFHQSRPYRMIPGMDMPEACHTNLAQVVKADVDIPVIAVGKIGSPELAERILVEQRADLIAMGRALICDPQLPEKARHGRPETIRYCIFCNQGCIGSVHQLKPITCLQNPIAGREGELILKKTESPKKVFVIGGGPAGLAAAAISARIGHRVTLVEKSPELGGQLCLAYLPPTRESIKQAIEILSREVVETGVEVITGRSADLQMIEEIKPDKIILAVGSYFSKPDIEGVEGEKVITAKAILLGLEKVGERVAVIGGGLVGAEVADFLSSRKHQVTIFEMLPELAHKAATSTKVYLTDQLARRNVQVICQAKVLKVAPAKVCYIREGWRFTLEGIDTIVLATGLTPQKEIATNLAQAGYDFEPIGDCLTPGDAMSAIYQGYLVALGLSIKGRSKEGFETKD